jgi:hypothetical protein
MKTESMKTATKFRLPLDGNLVVTQEFGALNTEIVPGTNLYHLGDDFSGALNTEILCTADGKVVDVGSNNYFGNYVIVEHRLPDNQKVYSLYAHLNYVDAKVSEGADLLYGQLIGGMGETGDADGVHLHFEISFENKFIGNGAFARGYDSKSDVSFGGNLESGSRTVDPSEFIAANDTVAEVVKNFRPSSSTNFPVDKVPFDKLPDHVLPHLPTTGKMDIDIVFSSRLGSFTSLTNVGTSSFVAENYLGGGTVSAASNAVALGDLDGDGDLDAILANTFGMQSLVLMNNGRGIFTVQDFFGTGGDMDVDVGDLDGDGDLDAITAGIFGSQVLKNDGTGHFSTSGNSGAIDFVLDNTLADVDGDGDLDVLVAKGPDFDNTPRPNSLLINDGDGNFAARALTGGNFITRDIAVGDIDGDGDVDALLANVLGPNQLLRNDGAGNFALSNLPGGTQNSSDIALGDVDRDGDLDAIVVNPFGTHQLLLNAGNGMFTARDLPGTFQAAATEAALGDFDNDGDLDVVIGMEFGENTLLTNNGAGSFTRTFLPAAFGASGLAIGDIDGDGSIPEVDEFGLPNINVLGYLPEIL